MTLLENDPIGTIKHCISIAHDLLNGCINTFFVMMTRVSTDASDISSTIPLSYHLLLKFDRLCRNGVAHVFENTCVANTRVSTSCYGSNLKSYAFPMSVSLVNMLFSGEIGQTIMDMRKQNVLHSFVAEVKSENNCFHVGH